MYSLVDLSWTTLIGNLYLSCYWNIHVYLTAFAIFTLFLPPAIHAFQAVSKELLLSQIMACLCLSPHYHWLPITFRVAQTLTQHPQKPVWLDSILPVRTHLLPLSAFTMVGQCFSCVPLRMTWEVFKNTDACNLPLTNDPHIPMGGPRHG